jgi:hypothetical protein
MTNCAKITRFFRTAQSSYHTKHYEEVCESWSREARVHHGFEAEYIVVGTFKSKAFRRAYVDEFAAAYQLNAEEKNRLLKDQLEKTDLSHEFQVALFVPEKKWEKIDKIESMWKLYLVNDKGDRVKPLEVERVNRQNADIKHFYPYVTPWKTPYVVRFPYRIPETNRPLVDKETKAITLVVTSVLGTAHLTWDLEQP